MTSAALSLEDPGFICLEKVLFVTQLTSTAAAAVPGVLGSVNPRCCPTESKWR